MSAFAFYNWMLDLKETMRAEAVAIIMTSSATWPPIWLWPIPSLHGGDVFFGNGSSATR